MINHCISKCLKSGQCLVHNFEHLEGKHTQRLHFFLPNMKSSFTSHLIHV